MAAVEIKQEPEIAKEKCTIDSNFAVVCAFIEQFGPITGVLCPSIGRLQVRFYIPRNKGLYMSSNMICHF